MIIIATRKVKTVLVSGASSGIGLAIVRKYIKEGYNVCGVDIAPFKTDIGMDFFICDITNEAAVKALFEKIKEKYSELNYVINCAGIFFDKKRMPINNIILSEWEKVLQTNVTGPMLITKYAIPLMVGTIGDKAIVNISSDQAIHPRKKNTAYAVSKGGLESFSKASAVELIDYGVRVNSVLPASVRSNFIRKLAKDDVHMQEIYEKENEKMPLGLIEPEEIAELVFFLGSEKSKKITGQSIVVDSGLYI